MVLVLEIVKATTHSFEQPHSICKASSKLDKLINSNIELNHTSLLAMCVMNHRNLTCHVTAQRVSVAVSTNSMVNFTIPFTLYYNILLVDYYMFRHLISFGRQMVTSA